MYLSTGAATLIQVELIGLISLGQQEVEHRVLLNNCQLHIDHLLPQGLQLYQPVHRYVFYINNVRFTKLGDIYPFHKHFNYAYSKCVMRHTAERA